VGVRGIGGNATGFTAPWTEADFERVGFGKKGADLFALVEGTPLESPVDLAGVDAAFTFGPASLLEPAARLGVNMLRFKESAGSDRYGTLAAVMEDLSRLGASFVRQPTANLLWPTDVVIPVLARRLIGTGYDISPLKDLFRDYVSSGASYPREELLTLLFQQADAWGIDIVLTIIDQGAGGGSFAFADPLGEFGANAPAMTWSEDHIGQEVDLAPFGGATAGFASVELAMGGSGRMAVSDARQRAWLLGTFDTRSPYKRQYAQFMAQAICEVLLEIDATMGGRVRARLLAIELFNEINTTCLVSLGVGFPYDGAAAWAQTVGSVYRGIAAAFDAAGVALPDLWLPSLASGGLYQPWGIYGALASDTTLRFNQELLSELVSELGSLSMFANQDMHWYHFGGLMEPDRPSACIVQDVQGLAAQHADTGADLTVSVCETGIPGRVAVTVGHVDTGAYSYMARVTDLAEWDRFQAREAWRRLTLALVGGAKYVAWHSFLSEGGSGNFAGCGLREDDSSVTAANQSDPRPAWSAFSRVARFIVTGSTSLRASLLWPDATVLASIGGDFVSLDHADGTHMTWIAEFRDPSGTGWVYVIAPDSVLGARGGGLPVGRRVSTVTCVPRREYWAAGYVHSPHLEGWWPWWIASAADEFSGGFFIESLVTASRAWYLVGSARVEVTSGDDPLVFTSNARLEFAVAP
jgi:hypothetical protein